MRRFIEGESRAQSTMFPGHLDDYFWEDNPVRAIAMPLLTSCTYETSVSKGHNLKPPVGQRITLRLFGRQLARVVRSVTLARRASIGGSGDGSMRRCLNACNPDSIGCQRRADCDGRRSNIRSERLRHGWERLIA